MKAIEEAFIRCLWLPVAHLDYLSAVKAVSKGLDR